MSNGEPLSSFAHFDTSLRQLIIRDDNGTMSEGTLIFMVSGSLRTRNHFRPTDNHGHREQRE